MRNLSKFIIVSVSLFVIVSMAFSSEAAPKKKMKKTPQPVAIEADELYFNNKTGEMFAHGNVVITQDKSRITTDLMRGNNKQMEVWSEDMARWTEPRTNITGVNIRYNYGAKTGTMQDIAGKCGDDYITGQKIYIEDGKYTAYNATTTGCPAKGTPDYRVTARKVEIWPDDKLIAYDARIWIKNVVVYSTPRYQRSLKKKDKEDEIPQFGYQDPEGFWVNQHLNYPLSQNISMMADLTYYTNKGFKPKVTLVDQEKEYSWRIITGEFRDDNSNWVKKSPEFRFDLAAQRIGKSPFSYTFNAIVGNWEDATKSSWHQDYLLYFRHDPIFLDNPKSWKWDNGFGFQHIRESFDGSSQAMTRFNTGLSKRVSPALSLSVGYNYTNNNASAFAFNAINVAQELTYGATVRIDKKTSIRYSKSFDLANSRTYENYYTLNRNLHCWDLSIQYRDVANRWEWNAVVVRF